MYSQEIESMSKTEVFERIDPIVNQLVEKHKFGSRFVNDLHKFVSSRYVKPAVEVFENIKKDTGLDNDVFYGMLEDMRDDQVFQGFSTRFQNILN